MGDGLGVDTAHCLSLAWAYEGGDRCVGADKRVACDEPDKDARSHAGTGESGAIGGGFPNTVLVGAKNVPKRHDLSALSQQAC